MTTRAQLKTQLRAMLGLSSDDPLASDEVLNPILFWAYQGVVGDIAQTCPDALAATTSVALTSLVGALPADLFQIRALRDTDKDGADLERVPFDELAIGSSAYAVTGVENPMVLTVSDDVTSASLYLSYTKGVAPTDLAADTDSPSLVPSIYHDVVALEALFAAELGGEQRRPAALTARWMDRKAALMAYLLRVGGPGPASRTRMVVGQGEFP